MCSTIDSVPAPLTASGFARLVAHAREVTAAVAASMAADPSLLAELPDEMLETVTLDLHATVDSGTAAATVMTGRLEREVGGVRGKLIAGRYTSTARFLEREARLSPAAAKAVVARGRDLTTHSVRVGDAWLAGTAPGGAVRDLTLGVTDVLRRSTRTDTPIARDEALDVLLPLAEEHDVRILQRAVAGMRMHIDPDGTTEEALFAFQNQTLSIVEAGSMFRVSGWLTPEAAAATRTVLEAGARQIAAESVGAVGHDDDCTAAEPGDVCTCGALDRARRAAGLRHDQLMAMALGEVMTDRLDDAVLGSHHRVAPHLTLVADITDAAAPIMGRLTVPGSDDDVLLGEEPVNRLLCDADVTRVLTTSVPADRQTPVDTASSAQARGEAYLRAVVTTLEAMARSVLYVGRSDRTVSARLRRALEARDGHCAFPGCRARVARCNAHHVTPWQHGGPTDLPHLVLLCVTHHRAVHEGGWTLALRAGASGHENGCWEFTPPPLTRRRLRP